MSRDQTVKAPRASDILVAIAILLAAAPRLDAQDNSSKIGGFCFRIDDQHPSTAWSQYRDVFKKRGSNFSFAANLGLAPLDSSMLRALVADGNELMDHTPEHSTLYFSDPDEQKYRGVKGFDHYVNGIDRVCLSIDRIDTVNSPGEIRVNIRNGYGYPVNSTGFAKSILDYPVLGIYSPEHRMFFRLTSYKEVAGALAIVTLWSAWNEPVTVADMDSVRFRLIHVYDLHVSDDGLALLAERSINLCKQYGLPSPTTWIQPGAPNPYLTSNQVKRVWGEKYQFGAGATFLQPSLKSFEEVDLGSGRFAMDEDINLDSANFDACKRLIADRAARHYVSIGLSHFLSTSQNSLPGDWQAYLNKTDSILAWCKRKNIPIKTFREWTQILYDTPQNQYVNVFPNLNTDLDEDGKPDGYGLAAGEQGGVIDKTDGAGESGGVSYSIKTVGTICRVTALGGLEKGVNAFSIYTKGNGGSVEVAFTLHSATEIVKKYAFATTTAQWKRYDTTLVIPNDVSTCDVQIQTLKVGTTATKISGMSLAKSAVQLTVTASAGSNGSISPSGVVSVLFGENKTFAITPNNGCTVASVLVDSVSVGAVSTYTFPSVTANHKISVTFRQLKKPVVVTSAATELTPTSARFNGSVNPNGLATTYRFEFGPTSSYGFATQYVSLPAGGSLSTVSNSMAYLSPSTNYHYRISASNADGDVFGNDIVFTTLSDICKVSASAGSHGTITPSGIVPVSFGGNQSFVITPNKGYRVASILVDTSAVGAAKSLQLSNVTKDEAVSVSFTAYGTTEVGQPDNEIPRDFALQQNYPNPFNPTTTLQFDLPKASTVTLEVFNVSGARVRSLLKGENIGAGRHMMVWDGRDESGRLVPSGVYMYRISAGDFQAWRKMTVLK